MSTDALQKRMRRGVAVSAVAIAALGAASPAAGVSSLARSAGCPASTQGPAPGRIFLVQNMTCAEALGVWVRGRGWMHVSLTVGGRFRVGRFDCVTYLNLTPPGPSDSDVHARCALRSKQFRLVYAV